LTVVNNVAQSGVLSYVPEREKRAEKEGPEVCKTPLKPGSECASSLSSGVKSENGKDGYAIPGCGPGIRSGKRESSLRGMINILQTPGNSP